jgi:hypothetical protein
MLTFLNAFALVFCVAIMKEYIRDYPIAKVGLHSKILSCKYGISGKIFLDIFLLFPYLSVETVKVILYKEGDLFRMTQNAASKENLAGAVMVLGGGIAGMQSAIDLANSGYYVYLVEKSYAIGGMMARLDKTFPTNDCTM